MIRRLYENFDLPDAPADDEPVAAEPLFDASALLAARQEAWNEGYLTASAAHARDLASECRQAYAELLARSDDMDSKLAELAEQGAASLARWLVSAFVAAFPALAAEAPDGRVGAVAELLRPALRSQCRIEVRAGSGPAVTCSSMHDAWRQVALRQTEEPAGGGPAEASPANADPAKGDPAKGDPANGDLAGENIVIAWPQGEARISSTKAWDDIRAAIMPLAEAGTDGASLQFTLKHRELTGHV